MKFFCENKFSVIDIIAFYYAFPYLDNGEYLTVFAILIPSFFASEILQSIK